MVARKRLFILLSIFNERMRLLAIPFFAFSLALKWFCPALRDKILPVRVTFKRFVNDLWVFIMIVNYSTVSSQR